MVFQPSDVDRLAKLARLALTEEEKARFAKELSSILEYVSQIQKVDTSSITEYETVVPLPPAWREDVVESSLPVEEALANAPDRKDNFFKVPRVI
ncbi:MAG TPA: Asp-tRNA(Asn)/Glu-tRNA(Gln) amidotransferase subunit GatC [candidate division Zixibacteria bacterium]|nr:Asp-tRNA(Asn)/Glu-tRNA(Gln) amidotransferase subunit GatC [candidate division Zixibacteria bacterium]